MSEHPIDVSARMNAAIAIMRRWGSLERYAGGYWSRPGLKLEDNPDWSALPYVGTSTVRALRNRGLVYCEPETNPYPYFAFPTDKLINRYATWRSGMAKAVVPGCEICGGRDHHDVTLNLGDPDGGLSAWIGLPPVHSKDRRD